MSRTRFLALAGTAAAVAVLLFASGAEAGSRGGGNHGGGYYGSNRGYYGGGIGVYPGPYYDYPYGYAAPAAPYYDSTPAADYAPRADASDLTAHVTVRAPADAEVWFGGTKTRQTGAVREFESPELMAGRKYTYEVLARWTQDGKEVSRTRSIEVSAGARKTVDFTKSAK
jgi:uncharacterized protein (TIGR03000 family)